MLRPLKRLVIVLLGGLTPALLGIACGPAPLITFEGSGGTGSASGSSSDTTSSGQGGATSSSSMGVMSSTSGGAKSSSSSSSTAGSPASSGSAGTSASSSSSSTSTSSSSSSTSTSSSSSSTSASSSSSSTSASSSSSSTSASSSSTSASSSGSTLPRILCNSGTCAAGQICCFNPTAPGDHCGEPGQCEAGYVELTCSVPADCPGAICCAEGSIVNNVFIYSGISCKATCPYTTPTTEFPLCTAGSTTECGAKTCVQSGELGTNYYVCDG